MPLPHGSAAEIRSPTGRDELELVATAGASPARRATALLARCLVRLDGAAQPGEDGVRQLVIGDREALLLHLRRHTFGDRIGCVVTCPGCERRMDVDLTVGQLLDRALPTPGVHLHHAGRVRFRLPRAGDVEAAADEAGRDPDAAARTLLGRCLQGIEPESVPPELVEAIEARMVEADPFAETVLSLSCPECGHEFRTWFDPADYLLRELAGRSGALFEEIHQLALHYHWSEADILDLPRSRRLLYLRLLADSQEVA